MQCPTVSWRCFEHHSGTASIDVHSATFCVLFFFSCVLTYGATQCLALWFEASVFLQRLSPAKVAGSPCFVQSWMLLASKPCPLWESMRVRKMEQCFKTYCQGLARWCQMVGFCCSRFCGFLSIWFGYLKISSWFCLHKLLVCALWFASLCCFARTSQHFGLPLALRRKTPHFHCLAEKVNTGRRSGESLLGWTSCGKFGCFCSSECWVLTLCDRIISYTTLHVFTLTPGGDAQLPGEPSYGSIWTPTALPAPFCRKSEVWLQRLGRGGGWRSHLVFVVLSLQYTHYAHIVNWGEGTSHTTYIISSYRSYGSYFFKHILRWFWYFV